MQCHPRLVRGSPSRKKVFPNQREYLKQGDSRSEAGMTVFRGQDKSGAFTHSDYSTFSLVMLFAQMPMVDTLCKKADVVGESRPKNPPTSKLVLNVMIKR